MRRFAWLILLPAAVTSAVLYARLAAARAQVVRTGGWSEVTPAPGGHFRFVESDPERVSVAITEDWGPADGEGLPRWDRPTCPPPSTDFSRIFLKEEEASACFYRGRVYVNLSWNPSGKLHESPCRVLTIRWPALTGALAVFPCLWLCAAAARLVPRPPWRRRPGLCPNCGYDLRASPGRCPECGKVSRMIADEARAAAQVPDPH
jgi:hypothetical protein